MIKRVIGLLIIFTVVSCSVFGSFVDMPENETDRNALLRAVENGLLNGVSENEIAPYASITRSQMGAILVRAMGASKESDISDFKDVSSNAWYYKELSRAVAMGAFEGDGGSNLYPDKDITYQEAFLVLSRIFDLRYENPAALSVYPDCNEIAEWAKTGVIKVVSGDYYVGDKLNPNQAINRVEFAKIMDRLIRNYIDTPGIYNELPDGNTLVRCDGVTFDGILNVDAKSSKEGDLIIIGDGVNECSVLNADGVNVVVRGGNVKLSGMFGIVRAVNSGTVLAPITGNYGGKIYADGSRGVISASAKGSYISLE